jgi:prepilin-type N-terminal cleavage/methylation domain-containing protein
MRQSGFTLTESVVAVAILVVVVVAAGRLFQSAGAVTGLGLAGADVLQEAAAIERQIRGDLARLSREGFLVIRCVAVPNDVRGPGPLLDPFLGPEAVIRADQILFFTHGAHSIQTLRSGSGADRRAQGSAARVYYGHAFQVPDGPPVERPGPGDDVVLAIDPEVVAPEPIVPWSAEPRWLQRVRFQRNATDPPGDYVVDSDHGLADATQPPARRWLLARQAVVLADDGGSPAVFLFRLRRGGYRSTASIGDGAIRNGRVDAAAGGLNDIRVAVRGAAGGGPSDPWLDQRSAIAGLLFYPRAQRVAPGAHRVDQALTSQVLAGACSSLVIDWTWSDGVGEAVNAAGRRFRGFSAGADGPHPWFGLDPVGPPGRGRGVQTLTRYVAGQEQGVRPRTIRPGDVEQFGDALTTEAGRAIKEMGAVVYEAVFGLNHHAPLDPVTGAPWPGGPDAGTTYTPWPSALRITMTLHDAAGKLGAGRQVQFVVFLG